MRFKIDMVWWRILTWVWYLPWPQDKGDAIFRYREDVAEKFNARHGDKFNKARLALAFKKFNSLTGGK